MVTLNSRAFKQVVASTGNLQKVFTHHRRIEWECGKVANNNALIILHLLQIEYRPGFRISKPLENKLNFLKKIFMANKLFNKRTVQPVSPSNFLMKTEDRF